MRIFPCSRFVGSGVLAVALWALGIAGAGAHVTGSPARISFSPSTVVEGDGATSQVTATVVLSKPAPDFFLCELRSNDPRVLRFGPIVFAKDQLLGRSTGLISWANVRGTSIRVAVFSVDNPDAEIWGVLLLKVKDTEE